MIDTLETKAEIAADKASKYPSFDRINLIGIKRKVSTILEMIGKNGLFDQYTKHDISHINEMLKSLEWIIPASDQEAMSPADWLMVVLAIYFHDLGMLVTNNEYENREKSEFRSFCVNTLFEGKDGVDYRAKIEALGNESDRDRFLYQEFVRYKHAERIRAWITGKAPDRLGSATLVAKEIGEMLDALQPQFRKDLGLVCESHHLDDLGDLAKYKPSQPYGNSEEETVNVQYAAILLRTADLLHITRERAPSIAYRLISPSDPVSQQEWAKQQAVTRVKAKMGLGKEGVPDPKAPQDTVEVHAYFTQTDGFFGLTSYLTYAGEQLQKSYDWVKKCREEAAAPHSFPWRHLDDSNVQTQGFLGQAFEFTLDQRKILDLLTGHTLYNDPSVAVRELVQNALDAVRLQARIESRHQQEDIIGQIRVIWSSATRTLTIEDNGTGMTQEIIERHLLRVGSSRYQDAEFKRQYSDYYPISRFGIGILSAFMITDDVEILTTNHSDTNARLIRLRSVHGKYLIQLKDKDELKDTFIFKQHGTSIKLNLRASANLHSLSGILQSWIVIPGCRVTLFVDNETPQEIGYKSARAALEAYVKTWVDATLEGDQGDGPHTRHRVEERTVGGTTIAFVTRWSEYFKVWNIVSASPRSSRQVGATGTCIEGIRVEYSSPGFRGQGPVCLVNSRGSSAPKTNVARVSLEATPERNELFATIYRAYGTFIRDESHTVHHTRGRSLTWAVQEARIIADSLIMGSPILPEEFDAVYNDLLLVLVEHQGTRQAKSFSNIRHLPAVWTVHSPFLQSAEYLIREAGGSASITALINALGMTKSLLPQEPVVCESFLKINFWKTLILGKEVGRIKLIPEDRRAELEWTTQASQRRWLNVSNQQTDALPERHRVDIDEGLKRLHDVLNSLGLRSDSPHLPLIFVASSSVPISNRSGETVIRLDPLWFFLPGVPITEHLVSLVSKCLNSNNSHTTLSAVFAIATAMSLLRGGFGTSWSHVERILPRFRERATFLAPYFDLDELINNLAQVPPVIFDPVTTRQRIPDLV